ncbi:MAG: hypothetical protein ACREVK_04795 [Gammaproteobacteria bacterium]
MSVVRSFFVDVFWQYLCGSCPGTTNIPKYLPQRCLCIQRLLADYLPFAQRLFVEILPALPVKRFQYHLIRLQLLSCQQPASSGPPATIITSHFHRYA